MWKNSRILSVHTLLIIKQMTQEDNLKLIEVEKFTDIHKQNIGIWFFLANSMDYLIRLVGDPILEELFLQTIVKREWWLVLKGATIFWIEIHEGKCVCVIK